MKEQDYLTGKEFFNSESLGITDKNLIQKFVANLEFPFLVSFPRTGSHWLRMLMELYFQKPSLTRVFYYHQSQDFLTLHSHDLNLELERKNVIYLWRNPVSTIYSQMSYCKEDVRDRERIKHWSKVYAKHLSKWLINENFTEKKTIIKYEKLRDSLKDEFAKITAHFDEALNLDRLEIIAQIVSKQEVKKKTKHDAQVIATDTLYETTKESFLLKDEQEIIDLLITENQNLIEYGILEGDSKNGSQTERKLLNNSESLEKDSVNLRTTDRYKIVGLVAARNEQVLIKQCLLGLAKYTDAIVYLDDASDDETLKIVESLAQECQIEKIIRKQKWHRNEPGDRNAMLRAGREIGGTHFIALDADELFTSNCLDNNFLREQILKLQPGDKILLNWIQLWRGLHQYRFDDSVWTWNYKGFIFCDDGQCSYSSAFIHTPRIPKNLSGSSKRIEGYDYGVMHFQFVNWRNLLIKQSWYRCLERIRQPQKPVTKINQTYAPSKDETNLGLSDSPYKWFFYYEFFEPTIYNLPEQWREKQVLQWFTEYGREYFAELDIFDVDWGKGDNNLKSTPTKYKVSAIVSTYNSEEFIRGCLQDLVEQTLYQKGELEIVVIDSASEQNERAIVEEFQSKYSHIIYYRTPQRETLYAAWNRAIKMSRGEYITNANTDDRHRPDALETMANYLDDNLEASVVYADQLITRTANETWSTTKATEKFNWPEFSYGELQKRSIIGPQPMWRKSLHEKYGYFRDRFKSSGDYEFWLRIGRTENIVRFPETLGIYYWNPEGLSTASETPRFDESRQIRDEYGCPPQKSLPSQPTRKPSPFDIFDQIYVLSLPNSSDRRQHIQQEFARVGITQYVFFDAIDKDSDLVKKAFAEDFVVKFPPCFRCGKRKCDCENNILIAPQVANFLSCQKLWQNIVKNGYAYSLILEDDVKFTDYYQKVVNKVFNLEFLQERGFTKDSASLLRLGWAESEDHINVNVDDIKLVPNLLKMSNPCYAITLEMAKKLLSSLDKIRTTSDIYTHDLIGKTVNNYTLMPPIVHDLSWSRGDFKSLIHPKQNYIDKLKSVNVASPELIAKAEQEFDKHFKRKLVRDILVAGHPRCGSKYMSQLLQAMGLDVGHNSMGKAGISSWAFAVHYENNPWAQDKYAVSRFYTDFDFLIQYVRNPRTAIPSIMVENQYAPDSFDFRKKHIELAFGDDISLYQTEQEKAIISFIRWNKIVQNQSPDLTVKVESCEEKVLRFCQQNNLVDKELSMSNLVTPTKNINSKKPYKGQVYQKPIVTVQMWNQVRLDLKKELNEFCLKHDYPKLYGDNWEYLNLEELIVKEKHSADKIAKTQNRLIFSINPGRSGSNYLAQLLGTAKEVISHHEAEPTIIGKYIRAINENNYDKSFSERWTKVEELKKSLNNLSPGQIYVDTSHVFIKTFFDVVVEEFKDNVEVIILRRNLVSVLKSFIELGYFSQKNLVWPDWMSSPNAKTAAIKCIGKDEELDQYDLCIAYLIDMEARALRFQKDYPWVKTYEVYLENLNDYDVVKKLFAELRITPTSKTREICAVPINQREAKKKEINAGQVSLEYCNQRIAIYIEKAKSMGIEMPKTLAWNSTPTSKQAEKIIQGKIKIAHIINPVIVNESSDLHIAQPITLATMQTAQKQAEGKVDVTIYTAQYPEDRAIIPESFIQTPDLDRSILDIAQFQNPRKLPLIKDILDRLYEAAPEADYLIYTNADIALQPHFYTEVAKIIEEGYDAFVINRRTIPDHYKDISEIPQMYAEKGEPHPGHDCFIFKRSLYEKSYLENHVIGVGFCFRPMFLNCLCHAEKFLEFRDLHLTFHIGNQETWKDSKLQDYLNHNKNEAQKIFDYYLNQNLLPNHPLIEERFDLFAKPLSSPTPSVELPADATAKDYYQLGEKLEKEKQLERALKAYQKAIEIDPNNSWYHHNLANIFRKQNQSQQAIAAYENAIKINPKFSWSHYHLGCLLEQQGKIQESISAYQTAVELYPNFKVYQSKLESLTKLAK